MHVTAILIAIFSCPVEPPADLSDLQDGCSTTITVPPGEVLLRLGDGVQSASLVGGGTFA